MDTRDWDHALELAAVAAPYLDMLEAGAPLTNADMLVAGTARF